MLIILLLLLSLTMIISLSMNNNINNMLLSSSSSSSLLFRFNTISSMDSNGFSISRSDLYHHLSSSPIPTLIQNILKEEVLPLHNTILSSLSSLLILLLLLSFKSLYILLESLRASDNIIDGIWLTGYMMSSSSFKDSTSHLLELNTIASIDTIVKLPTVSSLSSLSLDNNNNNTKEYIEYNHVIYPRRLCHRLLTVRDRICEELIEDLRLIVNENVDIKKSGLSQSFLSEKRATSIDSIDSIDDSIDESYSTIFRKNNFRRLSQVITTEVISIVRNKLVNNPAQLTYLDSHVDKNYDYNAYLQDDSVSVNEISSTRMKMLSTAILGCGGSEELASINVPSACRSNPRNFLQSLFAEGELRGLERQADGTYINKLKMAKDILDLRELISEFVGHILDKEQRENLKSYRSKGRLTLDDRESTPVFKGSEITKEMENRWLAEGNLFGQLRAAEAAAAAIKESIVNDSSYSNDGDHSPEDRNTNTNDEYHPDVPLYGQYGSVMLM